jgi:hypothetical protein
MTKHPYVVYEQTDLWKSLERSLDALVNNNDITLQTPNEYVIGYICQQLDKDKIIKTQDE